MLNIYYTLWSVFRKLKDKSKHYKKGFRDCLELYSIGLEKLVQYNYAVECEKLEKDKDELNRIIRAKNREIHSLEHKIKEKSLYAATPTMQHKEFIVCTREGEEFTILVNMSNETFYTMCINFAARFQYNDVEEAKAMMLQYINSKSAQGFMGYKDEKTALKDGVKIKRK